MARETPAKDGGVRRGGKITDSIKPYSQALSRQASGITGAILQLVCVGP